MRRCGWLVGVGVVGVSECGWEEREDGGEVAGFVFGEGWGG